MAGETVNVSGLRELVRDFGRLDKGLRRELQRELRILAREVRDVAQEEARRQGFAPPGRSGRGRGELLRRISYTVRAASAAITEGAVRTEGKGAPFKYPAVFEYGRREPWMRRPFMVPAAEKSRPRVEEGMLDMLDRLTSSSGLGRGGTL